MVTLAALVTAGTAYWAGHYQLCFWLLFVVALNSIVSTVEIVWGPQDYAAEASAAGIRAHWRLTAAVQVLVIGALLASELLVARAAHFF